MTRQEAGSGPRWSGIPQGGWRVLSAVQVPPDFLAEPGGERVIVVEVLDGYPDHLYPAALPLQVAIAVIDVPVLAAVVRAVGLDDQGTAPAHDHDVRGPRAARSQADTG
jgi:hypothetical protein